MIVGIISGLNGVVGPTKLITFLKGIDELWVAGGFGCREAYDALSELFPKMVCVRASSDKGMEGLHLGESIVFDRLGHKVLLAYGIRNSKDWKYCSLVSQGIVEHTDFDILVDGGGCEAKFFRENNLKESSFLYFNPGSVTPGKNKQCNAMRLELTEDKIGHIEVLQLDTPLAYSKKDGKIIQTHAFIEGSIVFGMLSSFSNNKPNSDL